jgi:hypothetical protein
MSIQTGKITAKQLLNSQVGREITGSISNMIHRGIEKTTDTLQQNIQNVSQNVKDRTSADNITNSMNKFGGKRRTRKHSGGFNIIENDEPQIDDNMNGMNVIEDDEPHVNVIENDYENEMNVIEDDEPHVNVIENDDEEHVNVIESRRKPVKPNRQRSRKRQRSRRSRKRQRSRKRRKRQISRNNERKARTRLI